MNRVKKCINGYKTTDELITKILYPFEHQNEYDDLKKIIIMDCDGIISDNKSYYTEDGKFIKAYGCYDKEIINFLSNHGWIILFVTDDKAGLEITKSRVEHIGYQLINANSRYRYEIIQNYNNDGYLTVFIGDSISDIPSLSEAKYSGTVSNAPDFVKEYCDYYSMKSGGEGGLADVLLNLYKDIYKNKFE